jgi:hypothetical protein
MLRIQGPATAKLVIDEQAPGARLLAQALDAKVEGGMYDALAMAVYQANGDGDFRTDDDIKVLTSWPPDWHD